MGLDEPEYSASDVSPSSTLSMTVSHCRSMSGDCSVRGTSVSSVHTLLGSPWVISTSMHLVSLPDTVLLPPVPVAKVMSLLLTLMSPSGVQVVLSRVVFANKVAVFRFLFFGYRMLRGTAIAVCIDC